VYMSIQEQNVHYGMQFFAICKCREEKRQGREYEIWERHSASTHDSRKKINDFSKSEEKKRTLCIRRKGGGMVKSQLSRLSF
jgi:hypothetical protein